MLGFVSPKRPLGSFRQNARRSPLVPSPLAGEGTIVCPSTRMGEGFLSNKHPSPILARSNIELPSPAAEVGFIRLRPTLKVPELGRARVRVGEGTITATALVASSDEHHQAGWSDPCIFLFFCRFGLFHPRSHDLKHTHTFSFPRRMSAPGVWIFASLTPNRGVGGAPRNVRVLR
jgi:hypothetical protein